MKKSINYDQVCLVPNYSHIRTRDELSTSIKFIDRTFRCPVLPANMACCIDFNKAQELSENNYFYILHRFIDYDNILNWITHNQHLKTISISVGVKEKDKNFIHKLYLATPRVDYITIDVAHGWHISVKEMIEHIISKFHGQFRPTIIAGNVMNNEACIDLIEWGADAVKIGLSQGKGCSTYNKTGVGQGMFSTIHNAQELNIETHIPMIADGGIREIGDICKSLVAGATMCMVGSEFAKCKDSPAKIETLDYGEEINQKLSKKLKVYYGSASLENKGHDKYIEGFKQRLPMKNQTYLEYLDKIEQGIRSCMSYNGSTDIKDLCHMKYILK